MWKGFIMHNITYEQRQRHNTTNKIYDYGTPHLKY